MYEVTFRINGKIHKRLILGYEKDIIILQVLELREDFNGKPAWYPVYVNTHKKFHSARLEFLGAVAEAVYENANNTTDTSRENIFVRGSFPHTLNRNGHEK